MLTAWLTSLILRSALDLEKAGKTVFRFHDAIQKGLEKMPVQEWEADRWARGLKVGLIRQEGHFFRAGTGKRGALSFFIRNSAGLLVGLRRESITQAATYVSLITDYGYPRERTRFETGWMDVAVYGEDKKALIYAENKANSRTLEKLCARLAGEFADGVPFPEDEEEAKKDDVLMKAQHIWRHRPHFFWGVCPTIRQAYRVRYGREGFALEVTERVPSAPGSLPK